MRSSSRRRRGRWVTWVACIWHALVVSGLPLPLGAHSTHAVADPIGDRLLAAKDRSRPFPCRDKPCGCVSAEQCFTSCCCHTPAQLLAWAERHALEPAVLVALAARAARETPAVGATSADSCCATRAAAAPSCCASQDTTATPNTFASERRAAAPVRRCEAVAADEARTAPALPPDRDDGPRSIHTLVLKAMLACGGIVAEWFSIGDAPPPPAVVAVERVSPLAVRLVVGDEWPQPRHAVPDVPPPRVA